MERASHSVTLSESDGSVNLYEMRIPTETVFPQQVN